MNEASLMKVTKANLRAGVKTFAELAEAIQADTNGPEDYCATAAYEVLVGQKGFFHFEALMTPDCEITVGQLHIKVFKNAECY